MTSLFLFRRIYGKKSQIYSLVKKKFDFYYSYLPTKKELIFISDKYYRPAEVEELLGDSTKVRNNLGWTTKYTFDDLIKDMVNHDCT